MELEKQIYAILDVTDIHGTQIDEAVEAITTLIEQQKRKAKVEVLNEMLYPDNPNNIGQSEYLLIEDKLAELESESV